MKALLLAAVSICAAHAQFAIYQVAGNVELPVATAFDFGTVNPGAVASIQFRIRNTSAIAASLAVLSVAGAGFSYAGPSAPLTLAPQAAIDFTVNFQGATTGLYSASLTATGIGVLVVAEVQQGLTYSVSTAAGWQSLAASPVNFGSVVAGSAVTLHFLVKNPSALYLTVPAIRVQGQAFALATPSPSGTLLNPQQTAAFDIAFTPPSAGAFTGTLQAGNSSFPLAGTGLAPPLPNPTLAVSLPQNASAQQGAVAINFDAPPPTGAVGTLTLAFQPAIQGATDPAIAFASGTLSMPFTLAAGSAQADFAGRPTAPFQTGTTAGTLLFTASIGNATAQQTVLIARAAIGITNAQATRSANVITVQITAYDNTRTAGKILYTFFDAQGATIAAIPTDATANFTTYFATATAGGQFALTATFPITGDATQIKSVQVQLTNSVGTATTQQIPF